MDHLNKRRGLILGAAALFAQSMLAGCGRSGPPSIGLMLDDTRIKRWPIERDIFVAAAKKRGATVDVKWANGDEKVQLQQFQSLVDSKVAVIVIVPVNGVNGVLFKEAVAKAHAAGVKVMGYDRMLMNTDLDAYVGSNLTEVGRMQAEAVLKVAPKGNYFLLGGAADTNPNAKVLRAAHIKVLQPSVDKGDIKIVGSEWVKNWDASIAVEIINKAFEDKLIIDAVVASSDGTAGGVIEVLKARGLEGKIPVSGQDAELEACKRIVRGTQTMTVFKRLKDMAEMAADVAFTLASGKEPEYNGKQNNDFKDVNARLTQPTLITKENMSLLVDEGLYTKEQLGL